jgi:hypothetical protein
VKNINTKDIGGLMSNKKILWIFTGSILMGCASKELVVKSYPADANVYIKGFDRNYFPEDKVKIGSTPLKTKDFTWITKSGQKKKFSMDDISNKEFYVLVEKNDFETTALESSSLYHDVKLNPMAKTDTPTARVSEDSQFAKIRISSDPAGAQVYVDGDFSGNTPYDLNRKPGKYQVKLVLPDHRETLETLNLANNDVRTLNFKMLRNTPDEKKLEIASGVKITSSPAGAEVFINGVLVGNTPYELNRGPANYKVRIQYTDYAAKEETISVISGENKPIHIQLEKSKMKKELNIAEESGTESLDIAREPALQ